MGRNTRLFKLASSLRRYGASAQEIQDVISYFNRRRCRPLMSEADLTWIVRSVCRYHPTH
jgi:hypothetical protein